MKLLRAWLARLGGLFGKEHRDRDLADEIESNLQLQIDDNLRSGMNPVEARRRALIKLGSRESIAENYRERRGITVIESLLQDVRFALRMLRKSPGFTTVAILTLALGIGACTAVFSLVNAVLLRALPYKDPQALVFLYEPIPRLQTSLQIPLEVFSPANADFYEIQSQSHSFTNLALFTTDRLNLSTDAMAVRVDGSLVTGKFFNVLGVAPELGRTVDADDDQPGKGEVAVISHALWQSSFGGSQEVLEKTLLLNARSFRIIGVMPPGFAFPHGTDNLDTVGRTTDVWIPFAMTTQQKASQNGQGDTIGHLRRGVSIEQAQAEMSTIVSRLDHLHPPDLQGAQAVVQPLVLSVTGGSRRALLLFMGAVALVLLIACCNVASLVLARATGRTHEMSVRSALGAPRRRLVRQLLTESLFLAGAGGVLGVLMAFAAVRILIRLDPGNIPRLEETSIDTRVLLFTVGISLLTGLLVGLFPAFSGSRSNLNAVLNNSGTRSIKGPSSRFHRGLIVGEVALTVMLLTGAGLFIRSYLKLLAVDKGFEPQSAVTMNIKLDARYDKDEKQIAFFRNLIEKVRALPGVHAAGAVSMLPLSHSEAITTVVVEGHPFEKLSFQERQVTPGYFEAMRVPLLDGRFFVDDDMKGRPRVAIVSRSFAKKYFFGGTALGKRFNFWDPNSKTPWWTIVGVVADVRNYSLDETPRMQLYTPLWQTSSNSAYVVARTTLDANQVVSSLRTQVRTLDPTVAVGDVRTMDQRVFEASAERRFQTLLLSVFGGLALLLSLVGVYAVIAYSVQQRTQEIGIRIALGAQPSAVLGMVLRDGLWLCLTGIAIGTGGALAMTRLMKSLIFEVSPTDPTTFISVVILLTGVALGACYIPARRASRVDPTVALRYE